MSIKRLIIGLNVLGGLILDRYRAFVAWQRENQYLDRKLNLRLDRSQKIRLPNTLHDEAHLHGDPEFGIDLRISVQELDALIHELDALCRSEKAQSDITLGGSPVTLMRTADMIIIKGRFWRNEFSAENIRAAIPKYKTLKSGYGEDGRFNIQTGEIDHG